jgi:hypothetical protein
MRTGRLWLAFAWVSLVLGCEDAPKTEVKAEPSAAASAASAAPATGELPPAECKASAREPVKLATVVGDVYGFDQTATQLYFSSWSVYGGRGDVGFVRKDGGGLRSLGSLKLEPRGLAVDERNVFYTSGIRLMVIPREAGDAKELVDVFPSHDIALHGTDVFGVPGEYGPYDRLAKTPKKGGAVEEIAVADRPKRELSPNGFSRLVVDGQNIYVSDSGHNRLISFPLAGGKSKTIVTGQDLPYELALAGDDLYFNLAKKGVLLRVPKAGGKATKVASGLVELAQIAADQTAAYTTFAGDKDGAPQKLAKVNPESGELTEVAQIAATDSVTALAVDAKCVYWTLRKSASETLVYARGR